MKTLTKLALAAVMLTPAVYANAQSYSGYRTTTTYSYPSFSPSLPSYSRSYTTYSAYSTPSLFINSGSPGYGCGSYSGYNVSGRSARIGGTTYHTYTSSDGGYLSGTTRRFGNTTYTALSGQW